jgi:hypothetical protein
MSLKLIPKKKNQNRICALFLHSCDPWGSLVMGGKTQRPLSYVKASPKHLPKKRPKGRSQEGRREHWDMQPVLLRIPISMPHWFRSKAINTTCK